MNTEWAAPLMGLKSEGNNNVQSTNESMLPNGSKHLPAEKQSMSVTATSKKTDTKSTTIRLERVTRPMDEYEAIQVEEYLLKHATLREGVQQSMNLIDSSATVLHSQMQDLLKVEPEGARRPGEWATQLAVSCGKSIAELIRAKTDAMRLLK